MSTMSASNRVLWRNATANQPSTVVCQHCLNEKGTDFIKGACLVSPQRTWSRSSAKPQTISTSPLTGTLSSCGCTSAWRGPSTSAMESSPSSSWWVKILYITLQSHRLSLSLFLSFSFANLSLIFSLSFSLSLSLSLFLSEQILCPRQCVSVSQMSV